MTIIRQAHLWLIALLAILLAACNPIASFTYNNRVQVNAAATFNATGSKLTTQGASLSSYVWNFGDGSAKASGVIVKHTYTKAGAYKVTLTVTDSANNVGTITQTIAVDAATTANVAPLTVNVQGTGGLLLANANVAVGALTAKSAENGNAVLASVPKSQDVVVLVTKDGYVPQSTVVNLKNGKVPSIQVTLLPIAQAQTIAAIEQAQTIKAASLNAQVTLPANALVDSTGKVATGDATVSVTPWDVKSTDLTAMLGNGQGIDATGKTGSLISAGMMTVDFYNAQGQHLQVAAGKTADIQMDLPYTSINGTKLAVGSTIPLWHFSETDGLWIQEGTGTVIASTTAATGLAVKGVVKHFSTWNWDFWYYNPGSATTDVNVKCVLDSGAATPCTLDAFVTLPDGSIWNHNPSSGFYADTTGATMLSVPVNATIKWTGSIVTSTIAAKGSITTTSTPTSVIITLPSPKSQKIACQLPSNTAVSCVAQLTQSYTDGTTDTKRLGVPADGAVLFVDPKAISQKWTAVYQKYNTTTNQFEEYKGAVSSVALASSVVIPLTLTGTSSELTVHASCGSIITGGELDGTVVDSCDIKLFVSDSVGNSIEMPAVINIKPNQIVDIKLPANFDTMHIFATPNVSGGLVYNGSYIYSSAHYYRTLSPAINQGAYAPFVNGESFVFKFSTLFI